MSAGKALQLVHAAPCIPACARNCLRQRLDLSGDDRKATPRIAHARRLDRCIDRDEPHRAGDRIDPDHGFLGFFGHFLGLSRAERVGLFKLLVHRRDQPAIGIPEKGRRAIRDIEEVVDHSASIDLCSAQCLIECFMEPRDLRPEPVDSADMAPRPIECFKLEAVDLSLADESTARQIRTGLCDLPHTRVVRDLFLRPTMGGEDRKKADAPGLKPILGHKRQRSQPCNVIC